MIVHFANFKIIPVVTPGKPAWKKIKKEFGDCVVLDNGELNREALGNIIFNDTSKRSKLNSITHPEIFKVMMWNCFKYAVAGLSKCITVLIIIF